MRRILFFRYGVLAFCLIALVTPLRVFRGVEAEDSGYDLLFLSRHRSDSSGLTSAKMNYLNISSGEIRQFDYIGRPISLSPNHESLAVFQQNRLCLVNNQWETEFCLAPDAVFTDDDSRWYEFILRWSEDSSSFWVTAKRTTYQDVSIWEIDASNGELLHSYTIEAEDISGSQVLVYDIFPSQKTISVGNVVEGNNYLFNLEAGQPVREIKIRSANVPDGRRLLAVDESVEGNRGLVVLDFAETVLARINSETFTSNNQDVWYQHFDGLAATWSEDLSMFVFLSRPIEPLNVGNYTISVFSLATKEARLLVSDSWPHLNVILSPDNTAIARLLCSAECSISLVTLDGVEEIFSYPTVEDNNSLDLYGLVWIPHDWFESVPS